MVVSSRTLEITVISGQNLSVDGNPVTENVYVVVRTESINCCTTRMAAAECGGHPSWNEKLWLDMPMHARSITFEVQCKTSKGVTTVGVARIAVSDFLGVPESCSQVLSYRLRNWEGRRSGVINFSVRVKTPEYSCSEVKSPAKGMVVRTDKFEAEAEVKGVQVGCRMNSNGVVTGIPIWWSYPVNI